MLGFVNKDVFYSNEKFMLILGDVTDTSLFNKEFSDLIVTSPPYNVGMDYDIHNDNIEYDKYLEFSEIWLNNCYRWTKSGGRLCLNIPIDTRKPSKFPLGIDVIKIAQKAGWIYYETIIWDKNQVTSRTAWGSWKSPSAPSFPIPIELIVLMYKDTWKRKSKELPDITRDEFIEWSYGYWKFVGETSRSIKHPAPFPRELPKRCIKMLSFPKDVVFDPFCGSGTTVLEAVVNNRYGIGVDISQEYLEFAKQRILKLTS